MINNDDLKELVISAAQAGFKLHSNDLQLLIWNFGVSNHKPQSLPTNMAAVYIFKWNETYLKVGKVNAKSNARYQFQHYNPDSSKSNLSKSLLNDAEFQALLGDAFIGDWIKENTTRFNILIPTSFGKNFVHFAEAFFILKCNPKFESTRL
jgi:hypothetical protein